MNVPIDFWGLTAALWARVAIFSHHQYKYNLRHGTSSSVMAEVVKTNGITPLLFWKAPSHRWVTIHTHFRRGSTHAFVSEAYTRDGSVDSNFFLVIWFLDSWPSFTSAHALMLPSNWCLSFCAHVMHAPLSHVTPPFEVPACLIGVCVWLHMEPPIASSH